jgi:hypothetical protein
MPDAPTPSTNTKIKPIKVPSVQGSTFLTNQNTFFNVEKLSIPIILRHSVNPYYVQVKSRVTNQMFSNPPDYAILNQIGEKDEKISAVCKRMCENLIDYNTGLKTNLYLHGQSAFGDIFDFGPAIFEPVWTDMLMDGINWKGLYSLNRLPIDTFRQLADGVKETPSQVVKGICMVDGKVKYYQYQSDNKFHEVTNILHMKAPNSRDLAGDALSWPIIPLIEILNYLIDLRRIKNARIAAPSVYVKMLSDDDDTIAAATDIITNQGSKQNFAHDENLEVYTLDIGNNGTVEDAIKSVENLIDAMYNPAAMISNTGTRLGGSDAGAERLIYAQANTFLSWLDLGFSTLIQRWLDINGFVGYTGQVWFPKLEVDKTTINLQTAKEGFADKALTRDEIRVLLNHDIADEDTARILDEEFASAPVVAPDMGVVQNSSRVPFRPNPAMPIVEDTADKLMESEKKFETSIYDALGIKI